MGDEQHKMAKGDKSWAILVLFFCVVLSFWACSTKNLLNVQKLGSIFVNSTPPGGDIRLDHVSTGKVTPDTIFNVTVGDHVISVTKQGYLSSPDSLIAKVNENEMASTGFVLLETAYGSLKVSSNQDGATICIDHEPTSEVTPHVFFNNLPIGTHIVSVFKAGYSNDEPAKEIVSLVTEDTVEVSFNLTPAEVGVGVGNLAPDFGLEDDNGILQRYYAYRGFVTIINFWSQSCTYCMEELPYLQQIYAEYLPDSLIIFGINYEDDFDVIRQIRQDKKLTFTLLKGAGTDVEHDYNVSTATGTPVTMVLDRSGKVYYQKIGFVSSTLPGKLREKLNALFGK
ncbi:MAG: redoxin domain-containing protein [Candidatus Zixiibacteriota bacterium]